MGDTFARNLRMILAEKRMAARALATAIGVSPQAVSQWISGQTSPSRSRLLKIATYLDIPVQRLIGHDTETTLEERRTVALESIAIQLQRIADALDHG